MTQHRCLEEETLSECRRPPSLKRFMHLNEMYYLQQRRRWKCFCPRLSSCLSDCRSVSRITQKRVHGFWMKCCVSTDVGTWTNWLTFEPDPDYSPDAGTGLFSPTSNKRCYAEFYVWKIRHICIGRCSEAWFCNDFIHWASEPSKHLCRRKAYIRSIECPSNLLIHASLQ